MGFQWDLASGFLKHGQGKSPNSDEPPRLRWKSELGCKIDDWNNIVIE
jgi:hypothetical protein